MAPTHQIEGSYLKTWLVIGPFIPDDLRKDFLDGVGGEANVQPEEGHKVPFGYENELVWSKYDADGEGIVNLLNAFPLAQRKEHVTA